MNLLVSETLLIMLVLNLSLQLDKVGVNQIVHADPDYLFEIPGPASCLNDCLFIG